MCARGRRDAARQNYESSLKKARAISPHGDVVGEVLRRMAELELDSGLRSQAIATARRALRVCQGCGEKHEIGFIQRVLGRGLHELGKPQQAEKAFIAAIDAFVATRNPYELACSRVDLAAFYLTCGDDASLRRAVREAQTAAEAFRALEDDRSYCRAALTLARAHKELGNHDDGILVLYDVERVCEERPDCGLTAQVRDLRNELECGLVNHAGADVAQVNLFGELYALTAAGSVPGKQVDVVLQSLCQRSRANGAFLALMFPDQPAPVIKAVHGIPAAEAIAISRHLAQGGVQHRVWSNVGDCFAERFPALTARATSALCQPLQDGTRTLGFLFLERGRGAQSGAFGQEDLERIATYASFASVVLQEVFREQFRPAGPEALPAELHPVLQRVITQDPNMFQILALCEKVARSNCTVLFSGETGTGKGLLAHCVHEISDRRGKKFIALNCAALPEPLLESELFGHARGAFTGADTNKIGLFEAAHGGTVFLDEVGKTSLFMQGKLLQFLDSSEVRPVGSNEFRRVDVRVICASKSDLMQLVEAGSFLEDLYYRLNDFPIAIPPLRTRSGDVRLLVEYYMERLGRELQKSVPGVSRAAMQRLTEHTWPGNVRELEKTIKRALILADEAQPVLVHHLPNELQKGLPGTSQEDASGLEGPSLREQLAQVEARLIEACMRRTGGNKSEAARILGVSYPSLLQKIKQYGVSVEPSR
jgi:transcriptional regulator with GAF, ATPase, and Fis domain